MSEIIASVNIDAGGDWRRGRESTMHDHSYETHLVWDGSTAGGHRAYSRDHRAVAPPSAEVQLSSDKTFGGNADMLNPEQLLVMAASSCQLLSFLAVAARAGVDVRGYEDEAVGVMPADENPQRITRITLRPHVRVGPGVADDRVHQLLEDAHHQCYIANSVTTKIEVVATVEVAVSRADA